MRSCVLLGSKADEFWVVFQNLSVLFNWHVLSVWRRCLLDRLYVLGRPSIHNTVTNIISSSVVEIAVDFHECLCFIIRTTFIARRLCKYTRGPFISNLMLSKLYFKHTLHFFPAVPMALSNCIPVFAAPQRLIPDLNWDHTFLWPELILYCWILSIQHGLIVKFTLAKNRLDIVKVHGSFSGHKFAEETTFWELCELRRV